LRIGKYFTLDELTVSQTAVRRRIPNQPGEAETAALCALCANVLDPLRELIGVPVVVTSGYRSPRLNRAVGGAATSQHCKGEAADIIAPGLTPLELAAAIRRAGLPFDQLIEEGGRWVHVSHRASGRNRGECLSARFTRTGVVYSRLIFEEARD
jgi:zinc D-Ala-D-Ala carboxypeptidase